MTSSSLRELRVRPTVATRSTVGLRGAVRAAHVGDRGRDRHRCAVGPAARRRRRDRGRRAPGIVGAGAAARHRAQRQDRPPRRPLRRDRGVAPPSTAAGRARGSRGGVAAAGQAPPRPGRAAHPGDLSAAYRCCASWSQAGSPATYRHAGPPPMLRRIRPADAVGDRTQAHRASSSRRGPPPRRRPHELKPASRPPSPRRARPSPTSSVSARSWPLSHRLQRRHRRFPSAGHYARYNGTAPIEASSGHACGTDSTPAATASSTTPSTSPRSPRSATTPPAATTTCANKPKARPQGSDARAQASHQRRRLPTTPRRRHPLNKRAREGNQGRLFNPAWPAEP